MKKFVSYLAGVLFSLCLIFILLITSFEAVCYWIPGYYSREFQKYEVADNLSYWMNEEMSYDSFEYVIKETMQYLRGNREDLVVVTEIDGSEQEFYNDNEISHMEDVRDLFVICIRLRWGAILFVLLMIFIYWKRKILVLLGKSFLGTVAGILVIAIGFGLLAASDFTKYFTYFHQIFFSQGNWLFDPRESRMINMLPEGFFSDTALYILICFLICMVICGAISIRGIRKIRDKKNI